MRALAGSVSLLAALAGCDLVRSSGEPDGGAGVDALVPINADLVPAVGGPDTLDVACWNIEWFPKGDRTVVLVADLIASLDLDIVVVEEIASVAAWDELVARLPEHAGILSSHRYTATSYQKIGVLYREGLMTAGEGELVFLGNSSAFPRPGLRVHLEVAGGFGLDVIGIHLKAGGSFDDAERRAEAMAIMDTWLRGQVDGGGEDEVIVLGDYNEDLDADDPVLAPFLAAPDRYTFRTTALDASDTASFIPSGALIDHIVTTAGLADEIGDRDAIIPDLEGQLPRYEPEVSDHLPVILSFPMP